MGHNTPCTIRVGHAPGYCTISQVSPNTRIQDIGQDVKKESCKNLVKLRMQCYGILLRTDSCKIALRASKMNMWKK